MMVIRVLMLGTLVLAAVPRVSAQELSSADTLSILVSSLETHLEQRWLWREARVWLRHRDDPNSYNPSSRMVEALQEVTPGLTPISADTNPYLCPDGGYPGMPLEDCPGRDDGRVMTFGVLEAVDARTVEIAVSIGTCCVLIGRKLRFQQTTEGGWEFVAVVEEQIT